MLSSAFKALLSVPCRILQPPSGSALLTPADLGTHLSWGLQLCKSESLADIFHLLYLAFSFNASVRTHNLNFFSLCQGPYINKLQPIVHSLVHHQTPSLGGKFVEGEESICLAH